MRNYFFILLFFLYSNAYAQENGRLFELSFQSFIQTNDLKNAEIVARKAVKLWPDEIKWEKRLAEILMWTKREKEAIDLYYKIYRKDSSLDIKNIAERIPLYNIDFQERVLKNSFNKKPDDLNFRNLFLFYKNNGDFKKAENLIEKSPGISSSTAKEVFTFYMESKNPKKAAEYADKMALSSCKAKIVKSETAFLDGEFKLSAEILKQNYEKCKKENDYLYALADISYLNMDFETGLKISENLIGNESYREGDAEKLFSYYASQKPYKAGEIALKAYKKFKKNYFLSMYFSLNIDPKEKEKQLALIEEAEKTGTVIESFSLLLKLKRLSSLTQKELNNLKNAFFQLKDKTAVKTYLWETLSSSLPEFKKGIAESLSCIKENDPEILTPLAYLKAATGFKEEALLCFEKSIADLSPSAYDIAAFGDFFRQAGYTNEALFFEKQAYDKLAQKDALNEEETAVLLRLTLNNRNIAGFSEKIKKSGLSKQNSLELILSYLSINELYEQFEKKVKEGKSLDWAELYTAIRRNDYESARIFLNNPNFRKDLAVFYSQQEKKDLAIPLAYEQINNSPSDNNGTRIFAELTEKFYPYSQGELFFSKRDFLEKKEYSLDKNFYFPRKAFLTCDFSFTEYSNDKKDKFLKSYLLETSQSLKLQFLNLSAVLGARNSIKNFFFATAGFNFNYKTLAIYSGLKLKDKPSENAYLETAGQKNSLLIETQLRNGAKHFTSLILEYNEFEDQKNSYLGNGLTQTLILRKTLNKTISLSPYFSRGTYSKASYSDNSVLYKVLPYSNARLIPENYNEAGLRINITELQTPQYRKKWAFPLSVTFAHNSFTHFIYAAQLNIKSPGRNQNYWLTEINYAKGSRNNNDTYFSFSQIFRFR